MDPDENEDAKLRHYVDHLAKVCPGLDPEKVSMADLQVALQYVAAYQMSVLISQQSSQQNAVASTSVKPNQKSASPRSTDNNQKLSLNAEDSNHRINLNEVESNHKLRLNKDANDNNDLIKGNSLSQRIKQNSSGLQNNHKRNLAVSVDHHVHTIKQNDSGTNKVKKIGFITGHKGKEYCQVEDGETNVRPKGHSGAQRGHSVLQECYPVGPRRFIESPKGCSIIQDKTVTHQSIHNEACNVDNSYYVQNSKTSLVEEKGYLLDPTPNQAKGYSVIAKGFHSNDSEAVNFSNSFSVKLQKDPNEQQKCYLNEHHLLVQKVCPDAQEEPLKGYLTSSSDDDDIVIEPIVVKPLDLSTTSLHHFKRTAATAQNQTYRDSSYKADAKCEAQNLTCIDSSFKVDPNIVAQNPTFWDSSYKADVKCEAQNPTFRDPSPEVDAKYVAQKPTYMNSSNTTARNLALDPECEGTILKTKCVPQNNNYVFSSSQMFDKNVDNDGVDLQKQHINPGRVLKPSDGYTKPLDIHTTVIKPSDGYTKPLDIHTTLLKRLLMGIPDCRSCESCLQKTGPCQAGEERCQPPDEVGGTKAVRGLGQLTCSPTEHTNVNLVPADQSIPTLVASEQSIPTLMSSDQSIHTGGEQVLESLTIPTVVSEAGLYFNNGIVTTPTSVISYFPAQPGKAGSGQGHGHVTRSGEVTTPVRSGSLMAAPATVPVQQDSFNGLVVNNRAEMKTTPSKKKRRRRQSDSSESISSSLGSPDGSPRMIKKIGRVIQTVESEQDLNSKVDSLVKNILEKFHAKTQVTNPSLEPPSTVNQLLNLDPATQPCVTPKKSKKKKSKSPSSKSRPANQSAAPNMTIGSNMTPEPAKMTMSATSLPDSTQNLLSSHYPAILSNQVENLLKSAEILDSSSCLQQPPADVVAAVPSPSQTLTPEGQALLAQMMTQLAGTNLISNSQAMASLIGAGLPHVTTSLIGSQTAWSDSPVMSSLIGGTALTTSMKPAAIGTQSTVTSPFIGSQAQITSSLIGSQIPVTTPLIGSQIPVTSSLIGSNHTAVISSLMGAVSANVTSPMTGSMPMTATTDISGIVSQPSMTLHHSAAPVVLNTQPIHTAATVAHTKRSKVSKHLSPPHTTQKVALPLPEAKLLTDILQTSFKNLSSVTAINMSNPSAVTANNLVPPTALTANALLPHGSSAVPSSSTSPTTSGKASYKTALEKYEEFMKEQQELPAPVKRRARPPLRDDQTFVKKKVKTPSALLQWSALEQAALDLDIKQETGTDKLSPSDKQNIGQLLKMAKSKYFQEFFNQLRTFSAGENPDLLVKYPNIASLIGLSVDTSESQQEKYEKAGQILEFMAQQSSELAAETVKREVVKTEPMGMPVIEAVGTLQTDVGDNLVIVKDPRQSLYSDSVLPVVTGSSLPVTSRSSLPVETNFFYTLSDMIATSCDNVSTTNVLLPNRTISSVLPPSNMDLKVVPSNNRVICSAAERLPNGVRTSQSSGYLNSVHKFLKESSSLSSEHLHNNPSPSVHTSHTSSRRSDINTMTSTINSAVTSQSAMSTNVINSSITNEKSQKDNIAGCEPLYSHGVTPPKQPSATRPNERVKAVWGGQEVDVSGVSVQTSPLVDRLKANVAEEVPNCTCLKEGYDELREGPYYTHLGAGRNVTQVRSLMEHRLAISGTALRIEKVLFTGKEGKNPQGCPIAKWIIRRGGPDEKVLVLVRPRRGHSCDTAVMVIGVCVWDGVAKQQADTLYDYLRDVLPKYGHETERRCGLNERRTCACQGWDGRCGGGSFTFGCSWSMYYNGCKFAKSLTPRKFKLKKRDEEPVLEHHLQSLATQLSPMYKQVAPNAFTNMVQFEEVGRSCRLGNLEGCPFSGVTAVVDFSTHSHKDQQNMNNGCTMVVTLTKHRGFSKPSDEQLHVLPLCVMDTTDENGSLDGQYEKIRNGSIEYLTKYSMKMRVRAYPLLPCKQRKKFGKNAMGYVGRGRGRRPSWKTDAAKKMVRNSIYSVRGRGRGRGGGANRRGGGANNPPTPKLWTTPTTGPNAVTATTTTGDKSTPFSSVATPGGGSLKSTPSSARAGKVFKSSEGYKYRVLADGRRMKLKPGRPLPYPKFWQEMLSHPSLMRRYVQYGSVNMHNQRSAQYGSVNTQRSVQPPWAHNHFYRNHVQWEQWYRKKHLEEGNYYQQHSPLGASNPGHVSNKSYSEVSGQVVPPNKSVHDITAQATPLQEQPPTQQQPNQNGSVHRENPPVQEQPIPVTKAASVDNPSGLPSFGRTFIEQTDDQQSNVKNTNKNLPLQEQPLNKFPPVHEQPVNKQERLTNGNNIEVKVPDIPRTGQFLLSPTSTLRAEMSVYLPENSKSHDHRDITPSITTENSHPSCQATTNAVSKEAESIAIGCPVPDPLAGAKEVETDCEQSFMESDIGGVAIALSHGSVLFEVAKRELHATTAMKKPNRYEPTRISLVFYQHKNLNLEGHGYSEYLRKSEMWRLRREGKLNQETPATNGGKAGPDKHYQQQNTTNASVHDQSHKLFHSQNFDQSQTLTHHDISNHQSQDETLQSQTMLDNKDFPLFDDQSSSSITRVNSAIKTEESAESKPRTESVDYRWMWDASVKHCETRTSDSVNYGWLKPQPAVTGPYQRWL